MNETPASPENTVVVTQRHLSRLRCLVIVSLCLNGLILLLILCAVAHHHHHMKEGFGRGGWGHCHGGFGGERGFHHHHFMGRGGSGGPEGFSRPGGEGRHFGDGNRGGFDRPGFNGEKGGPGWGGGDGKGFGGPRPGMEMGMGRGMDMKTPPDPARMTDGILAHLTQQLTLTDDQKAKIKPIVSEQVTQFQKDEEARRQAMQKAFTDTRAKIRPLLNTDQQKQLDSLPVPGQKPAVPAAATAPAKENP